jgi:hypothetical protein
MIYAECKPDALLVRYLTDLPKRQIVHDIKGKAEVCKRISAQRDCKALVDEDPSATQPLYLARINLWEDVGETGLKVYHDNSRDNLIVVMCPKLEDWILQAAEEAGIDVVRKYSLPDNPAALHRMVNANLPKFERLVKDLLDTTSERVRALRRLLS